MTRRRRGALLLGLAAVCAALAASSVDRYADDVAAQVGPLQPVLVAARDLRPGTLFTPAVARTALVVRRVPLRFAPRRALQEPSQALGYRALTLIAAGDYVGETQLGTARPQRPPAAQRGRLVQIAVTGAEGMESALHGGAIVDVLVTTEAGAGPARTYLALQRLELVGFRSGEGGEGAKALATLRTTLRQAVTLTAAQNFAREVRIVPRAAGDLRRLRPTAVGAAALGR